MFFEVPRPVGIETGRWFFWNSSTLSGKKYFYTEYALGTSC